MSKTKKGSALLGAINAKAPHASKTSMRPVRPWRSVPRIWLRFSRLIPRKTVDSLSNVYLKKIARYLEAPLAQVYVLAGILTPADFVLETDFAKGFQRVLEIMRHDNLWSGLVPDDDTFSSVGQDIKLLIALLYERTTSQSLIAKASIDSPFFEENPLAVKIHSLNNFVDR